MYFKKQPFSVALLLLLMLTIAFCSTVKFPASFTVARSLTPPFTIDTFMQKIGCCSFDSRGQPNGYTIVSLDGFKASSTTASIRNGVSPLGFWMNAFEAIAASKAGKGGGSTGTVQQYIVDHLHKNGITIIFNALSGQAPVSQLKVSAQIVANNIVDIVRQHDLDGVSIQFDDFQAVAQGTASAWLQELLSVVHFALPNKLVILIVPVTIVGRVRILQEPLVSALVDVFVLKYYGFNADDYTTYSTLFSASSVVPSTAFAELLKAETVGIDLCRTLIAKPTTGQERSFMGADLLSGAFSRAKRDLGWFGGFANLDFLSDQSGQFQKQVLQPLRQDCLLKGDCVCR